MQENNMHNPSDEEEAEVMADLRLSAEMLVGKLQTDDYRGASDVIRTLVDARDRSLYKEVGRLTRGLHQALIDFNIDADIVEKDENNLPVDLTDASHRLTYVIEMMRKAADKTMDSIDVVSPIVEQLSKEASSLQEDWVKLRKGEMTAENFRSLYARIDEFLDVATRNSAEFSSHLQEILLAQSYQDLSGQIIRRVIAMVQDVEKNLVDLVRRAGYIEQLTGIVEDTPAAVVDEKQKGIAAEGPQVHAHKLDNVARNQDEVDDLLSSLGF